ncbi:MAG: hypothetical protein K0R98_1715, partial [Rickettsiaceae bacterium]|nr:hypothetical protein [Rickettsiaceae bacterium]
MQDKFFIHHGYQGLIEEPGLAKLATTVGKTGKEMNKEQEEADAKNPDKEFNLYKNSVTSVSIANRFTAFIGHDPYGDVQKKCSIEFASIKLNCKDLDSAKSAYNILWENSPNKELKQSISVGSDGTQHFVKIPFAAIKAFLGECLGFYVSDLDHTGLFG